jgi:hypothetical protein
MIEVTKNIKYILELVKPSARDEVLKMAWEACCDGATLPDLDYDPWDGLHEEKRMDIEEFFVLKTIEIFKGEAKNHE